MLPENNKGIPADKELHMVSSASSTSPTNLNEDVSRDAVPGSSKHLNKGLCSTQKLSDISSSNNVSKTTLAESSKALKSCSSFLVNENISSQKFVSNPSLSTSFQNSHLQDVSSNLSLKRSVHSASNPEISDEDAKKKKSKMVHLKVERPLNSISYDCSQDSSRIGRIEIDNVTSIDDYGKEKEHSARESGSSANFNDSNVAAAKSWQTGACCSEDGASTLKSSASISDDEDIDEKYFESLPYLTVKKILDQLSFSDLMKARSVCKLWNEIIINPRFLSWKKAYNEIKFQDKSKCWLESLPYFDSVCTANCFKVLISFMNDNFWQKPPDDLKRLLPKFSSCVVAEYLLLERFPKNSLVHTNPWCILALTVILSSTVKDLYGVFSSLINYHHCDYFIILEVLFCIATILLHFMRKYSINHGHHYRLYNVIYMLENEHRAHPTIPSLKSKETNLSRQQSSEERCESIVTNMSDEQREILNHRLAPNQIVKILATAGTGKTTTLIHFTKKHPNLKFLHIASRELGRKHAASIFPSNVVCKTIQSLVYETVGNMYEHKLTVKLQPADILPFLHRWSVFSHCLYQYSESILSTIERFIQSADEYITRAHVYYCTPSLPDSLKLYNQIDSESFCKNDLLQLIILNETMELWKKMISKDNIKCKITPDIYHKLFQLSCPSFQNYNCIIIDEAEDLDAVMLKTVCLSSQSVPVILAIDQLSGEYNSESNRLSSVGATHTYYLTKSFRFGSEIAYVANCCTEILTGNTKNTLVGNLKKSYVDGTVKGQCAIITRTDFALFLKAHLLCCTQQRQPYEPEDFRGAFVGGFSAYNFAQIIDVYKLKSEGHSSDIKDELVKKFMNFNKLKSYAMIEDKLLYEIICMVIELGTQFMNCVDTIKRKCSYDVADADIVFSTVYNAKGLEFDSVILSNDAFDHHSLVSLLRMRCCLTTKSKDFFRLTAAYNDLYFTITRAKTCLLISNHLFFVLAKAGEEFEYLSISSAAFKSSRTLECAVCGMLFSPSTLMVMNSRNIMLSTGLQMPSGSLCRKCAVHPRCQRFRTLAEENVKMPKNNYHVSMADFVSPLSSK